MTTVVKIKKNDTQTINLSQYNLFTPAEFIGADVSNNSIAGAKNT